MAKRYTLTQEIGRALSTIFESTKELKRAYEFSLILKTDTKYRSLRAHLSTRKTFFHDLRALTRYVCFESWDHLLTFMLEGLELQVPADTS